MKKQYNERTQPVNTPQPENLDIKFRYIKSCCMYIMYCLYSAYYSAEEVKEVMEEGKDELIIIEEKKGM